MAPAACLDRPDGLRAEVEGRRDVDAGRRELAGEVECAIVGGEHDRALARPEREVPHQARGFEMHGGLGIVELLEGHGLEPEVYVSHPGPYFLDTAQSAAKRRVMRLTQLAFQREAKALGIPTHLTPVSESVLMRAFAAGSVVVVLVSGYHMVARGRPHWIFAFGRDGRRVLMHDPAAIRDDQGMAAAAETYAVPWTAFERVTRLGRERLSAAIVIRKGPS